MSKYAVLILPFFIVSITITGFIINKSTAKTSFREPLPSLIPQIESTELVSQNLPLLKTDEKEGEPKSIIKVLVTAYSSSPEETDEHPLITASGSYVRPGIVAANFLPFGTKIRLPEIFGDRVFVVEDRLHEKNSDRIDIWFSSKKEAMEFGVKISEVEILD